MAAFEQFLHDNPDASPPSHPRRASRPCNRSIKFRARYRYGLKQIGSLRFRFGGMFAHAPCWRANSLIQSASYPRSASNIVCGSRALRRTEHSRLSCAAALRQAMETWLPIAIVRYFLLMGGPTSERWRRMMQRAEAALRPLCCGIRSPLGHSAL
jgi:hypothetical protein